MKEPGQLKDVRVLKCGKCEHYKSIYPSVEKIAAHCDKYGYILVGGNACKECVKNK